MTFLRDFVIYSSDDADKRYKFDVKANEWKYFPLHWQMESLADILARKLHRKITTDKVWRVNFYLCPSKTSEKSEEIVGGVLDVFIPFDFTAFLTKNSQDRTVMVTSIIIKRFQRLCMKYGWNFEPFQQTIQEFKSESFQCKYLDAKRFESPNKSHYVRLGVEYNEDRIHLNLHLFRKGNNKAIAVKSLPSIQTKMAAVGQLKQSIQWSSDYIVIVKDSKTHRTNFSKEMNESKGVVSY